MSALTYEDGYADGYEKGHADAIMEITKQDTEIMEEDDDDVIVSHKGEELSIQHLSKDEDY